MPGTVLKGFHVLSHFIFTTTLERKHCYFFSVRKLKAFSLQSPFAQLPRYSASCPSVWGRSAPPRKAAHEKHWNKLLSYWQGYSVPLFKINTETKPTIVLLSLKYMLAIGTDEHTHIHSSNIHHPSWARSHAWPYEVQRWVRREASPGATVQSSGKSDSAVACLWAADPNPPQGTIGQMQNWGPSLAAPHIRLRQQEESG